MTDKLLDLFYEQTGICFTEKKDIVKLKIENFYKNNGFDNFDNFLVEVQKHETVWQNLVNFLTVNETYFLREIGQLELLAEEAKHKNSFDILCLPSSSGEEVYSIIMMLEMNSLLGKLGKIVGVDINSDVIKKAEVGKYGKRSFHKMTSDIKSQFFDNNGEFSTIKNIYKQKAKFVNTNIFDPKISELGKFDFLFSRNMLIYFDKNSREKATKVLIDLIKDGGYLFLGHADMIGESSVIKKHIAKRGTFYQKNH